MVSANNCIHCHKCRDNCDFLTKYGIDIGDTERLRELAYHCFLCGRCSAVCPAGIDGRELIMEMRCGRAAGERIQIERTYKGLIGEKRDYKFRNWKHATSGSVFFPGCNFPSMYPKTNALLEKVFRQNNIGTVYECCGKPIAELGLTGDEQAIVSDIRRRLEENGVTEIVTACPNCMYFLSGRLGVTVRSVYSKLAELGIGSRIVGDLQFYLPCPDRAGRKWIEDIRPFVGGDIRCLDPTQCCGLGGSAIMYESDIAKGFVNQIIENTEGMVYTYCASCMGRFRRSGFGSVEHILPVIMDTVEQPDTKKSYFNRVITRFK